MYISVTDPIGRAINRTKWITFQPFSLGKWFVLGFVAFLATLDEGGASGNFNLPDSGRGRRPAPVPGPAPGPAPGPGSWPGGPGPGGTSGSADNPFEQAWNWVS